jgi:hypothetical protein
MRHPACTKFVERAGHTVAQSLLSTADGLESQVIQCQNACRSVVNYESANCKLKPACMAVVEKGLYAWTPTCWSAVRQLGQQLGCRLPNVLKDCTYGLQRHNVLQHHMCTSWAALTMHFAVHTTTSTYQSAKATSYSM